MSDKPKFVYVIYIASTPDKVFKRADRSQAISRAIGSATR